MTHELMIDGLPSSYSEQQLNNLFSQFGRVLSASVLMDSTGRSLRMGKVTMSTEEEAKKAKLALHRSNLSGSVLIVFPHDS